MEIIRIHLGYGGIKLLHMISIGGMSEGEGREGRSFSWPFFEAVYCTGRVWARWGLDPFFSVTSCEEKTVIRSQSLVRSRLGQTSRERVEGGREGAWMECSFLSL